MNFYEIKETNWHYRFIAFVLQNGDYRIRYNVRDLCAYWRLFTLAVMKSIMLLFFGLIILGLVAAMGAINAEWFGGTTETTGFFLGLFYGIVIASGGIFGFISFFLMLLGIGEGWKWALYKWQDYREDRPVVEKPESLMVARYKSWKGKHCRMIKIVPDTAE